MNYGERGPCKSSGAGAPRSRPRVGRPVCAQSPRGDRACHSYVPMRRMKAFDGAMVAGAVLGLWALARDARRRRRFQLGDRVALVTGGSRGLGLVLARELVREGAQVAICARDEAELARARHQFAAQGADVLALTCDVTDRDQVEEMLAQVRERLGPSNLAKLDLALRK